MGSAASTTDYAAERKYFDALLADKNIEILILSKTTCGYSSSAKDTAKGITQALKILELNTTEKEFTDAGITGMSLQNFMKKDYDHGTVPVVFVTGKFVGGNDKFQEHVKSGQTQAAIDASKAQRNAESEPTDQ